MISASSISETSFCFALGSSPWLGISIACRSLPDYEYSARASTILSPTLTGWAIFICVAYFLYKTLVSGRTYPASCSRSHRFRSMLCSLSATNFVACLPACALLKRSRLPHRRHLYGAVRRPPFISAAKPGCSAPPSPGHRIPSAAARRVSGWTKSRSSAPS